MLQKLVKIKLVDSQITLFILSPWGRFIEHSDIRQAESSNITWLWSD